MIGSEVTRVEDNRLVTGRGAFIDNVPAKVGTAHAAILRSPHPHALIKSINIEKAVQLPGVKGVITGEYIEDLVKPFSVGVSAPVKYFPLAIDKVRYVGEPVAIVVAVDRYVAEDALELIDVTYERLKAVVDIEESLQTETDLLHENVGSNIANHREFN